MIPGILGSPSLQCVSNVTAEEAAVIMAVAEGFDTVDMICWRGHGLVTAEQIITVVDKLIRHSWLMAHGRRLAVIRPLQFREVGNG